MENAHKNYTDGVYGEGYNFILKLSIEAFISEDFTGDVDRFLDELNNFDTEAFWITFCDNWELVVPEYYAHFSCSEMWGIIMEQVSTYAEVYRMGAESNAKS